MSWEILKLKDVSNKIQYGYTESAIIDESLPKFLRITDIVESVVNWDTVPNCKIEPNELSKYILKKGDVVVARTGNTTGYAKLINEDVNAVFASYLIRFQFNKELVVPEYIGKLIESNIFKSFVNQIKSGTAQGGANANTLSNFEFLCPPLPTQKRIASILSNYDDLIENNLKRIKLLEETAQNIYKEWFVNFRFPNYENTPFNKETGLPIGWEMKKLSELVYLTMGQSPESEYYNINNEGLPFHQGVTGYGHRFVNHSTYCSKITRIAEEGDILFSVRAPVGRLNIAPDKLIIGRGLSAIKNKEGYQSFQFYQLKNHFFQEDMIGGGAIFNSVTKSDLENQLLIYPMNNLIVNFEKIVKPIDGQIWKLNIQNQKLKVARDILLPRLMNRTIEV